MAAERYVQAAFGSWRRGAGGDHMGVTLARDLAGDPQGDPKSFPSTADWPSG